MTAEFTPGSAPPRNSAAQKAAARNTASVLVEALP